MDQTMKCLQANSAFPMAMSHSKMTILQRIHASHSRRCIEEALSIKVAGVDSLGCHAGREMLIEEEVPEDQIEAELAPLTTQLAYVAGQLGRHEDAVSSLEVSIMPIAFPNL